MNLQGNLKSFIPIFYRRNNAPLIEALDKVAIKTAEFLPLKNKSSSPLKSDEEYYRSEFHLLKILNEKMQIQIH